MAVSAAEMSPGQGDRVGNKASGKPRKRLRTSDKEPAPSKSGFNSQPDGPVEWKKIKEEQRDLKKKRKEKKHADFYEVSMHAKQLWEQIRVKKGATVTKNMRKEACDKAFKLLRPHLKRCVGLHDMSRVVQSMIDVGGPEMRKSIFDALATDIIELSKNKYACHTMVKLLPCVGKGDRKTVLDQVRGNIGKLLKHKFSARIIESLYSTSTNKQDRVHMLMECFGPEFKLFTDNSCTNINELLTKYPDKRERVLASAKEILDKAISRGPYLKQTILIELLCQYLSNCDEESRTEYIESVKETLANIYETREGANLAMICIWHGSAQVRKAIIKSFKSKVVDVAKKKFGHLIWLCIFDCVDDTKLISKTVVKELVENLSIERGGDNLLLNTYARKVIHYLIRPRDPSMINGDIINILQKGDGNLHSKKDMSKRQQELSEYAIEMILPIIKEYGDALSTILNDDCAALIIIGFLNASTADDNISEVLLNIANWFCNVEEPRKHTRIIKALISKDEGRKVTFSKVLKTTMAAHPKVSKLFHDDPILKTLVSN